MSYTAVVAKPIQLTTTMDDHQIFRGPRYLQSKKQQRRMNNNRPLLPGSKKIHIQNNEPNTANNTMQCRQSSFHCNGSSDIRTRPSSMQHRRHTYQLCCSTSSRDIANNSLQHGRRTSLPQPSFSSSSMRHHQHIPNTYTPQLDTEKIHASNPFVAIEQEGLSPCLLHCQPAATSSNTCSPCSSSPYLSTSTCSSHHCCPTDDFSCDGSTLAASDETLGSSSPTIVIPPPSPRPTRSSSSRIKSAFSKIIVTQQPSMAKGASLPTPVPTRSASLVERIRLKFQKNQQQPVVNMHKSVSMTRSSSLSSITWARLRSKKQVTPHEDDMELPISTNHDDLSRYGHDVEDHRPLDQVQQRQRRYRPQAPKKPHGAYPPPRPSRTTRVRFAQVVSVHETFSQKEYVRGSGPEDVVCTQLTPSMAQYIKEELNQFKLYEMKVHHSSRSHTHFFM